jgi:predicted Ser/Thr protein kinase
MSCAEKIRDKYRQAHLNFGVRLDADRRVLAFRDGAVNWTLFQSLRCRMRDQGWKIHVAASIGDCPHLFADVVPFLLASGCSFKLPASIDDAITVNSGRAGATQIGKIVTVYPGDDSRVRGLAAGLDRLWQSDQAPEILTDLRIRPGSAVYIRFGAFTSQPVVQDLRGVYHSAVRRPDGVLVPDERRLDGVQPAWARSPIAGAEPVQAAMQQELALCGKRYLLLGRLQSAAKGGTFLTTDTDFAATYVVKIARRGVGENATGLDCRARLKRECEFLRFLAARGFKKSPKLVASADNAIVVEDIDGTPLHELPRNQIAGAFRPFVAAVAELHRLGVIHRDLKLSNAILAVTDVYLLDFELSAFAGAADAPSGGTRGHMAPERIGAPAAYASDIFSLGASLAHAALGADPGTLAPGAGRLRALLTSTGQNDIAKIVTAAMDADPRKRPTARELATRLAELPDEWPTFRERREQLSRARAERIRRRRARKIREAAFSSSEFLKSALARPAVTAAPGLPADALSSGHAGIILGLAAVDFAMKRSDFDDIILSAAEGLARNAKKGPALGFFTGQAGIAFVLALVGTKYARNDLLAAGRELFTAAAQDVVELDLFSGAAGIVWSAWLLASILQAQWPLRAAENTVRRLTQSVNEQGGVLVWPSAVDEVKDAHLGAAHGSAGIAMSLAVWGRASGCARSLELAHDTFLRLFQNGRTSEQRELLHRWDSEEGTNCGTWCHGSAGFLWCMLQAFGDHFSLRAPIDWAVGALAEVPLLANPGYCHGMAGQLDLWSLLARYPRLAEIAKPRAALAAQLTEQLGFRADSAWAWSADDPDEICPDLWTGALGPACALSLFQRGQCDSLFSVETLAGIFAPKS